MTANSAFFWQLGEQAFACQEILKNNNEKPDTILSPPPLPPVPIIEASPPPSPIPSNTVMHEIETSPPPPLPPLPVVMKPSTIANTEKETKYGKFMGKILLQKKAIEKQVTQSCPTKTTTKTTTYPSYFRIDLKPETNEKYDIEQPRFKTPPSNEESDSRNTFPTLSSLSKKLRKKENGVWTRWDVLGSVIIQNNIDDKTKTNISLDISNAYSENDNSNILTKERSQSEKIILSDKQAINQQYNNKDDSKLNLETIDNETISKKNQDEKMTHQQPLNDSNCNDNCGDANSTVIKKKTIKDPIASGYCPDCYFSAMDRKCFESIDLCEKCQKNWRGWPNIFFSLLIDNVAEYSKNKETYNDDDIASMAIDMMNLNQSLTTKLNGNISDSKNKNKVFIEEKRQNTSNNHRSNKNKSQPNPKKKQVQQQRKKNVPPPTQSRNARKLTARKKSNTSVSNNKKIKVIDDESTFENNKYGYNYGQIVEVLNINGHWYTANLVRIKGTKVKVSYKEWDDQDEWIFMSSKRLRIVDDNDNDDTLSDNSENSQSDNETKDHDSNELTKDENNKDISDLFISTPLINVQPINSKAADYVTSTLDTDPDHIFNNNEVFMTRRMAREMVDEHGFMPNSYGYCYGKAVGVTYLTENKDRKRQPLEWIGYLRQMHKNQVRVWFPSTLQSDWVAIGSRRLRVLTTEEDNEYRKLGFDTGGDDQLNNKDREIKMKRKASTKVKKRKSTPPSSINNPESIQELDTLNNINGNDNHDHEFKKDNSNNNNNAITSNEIPDFNVNKQSHGIVPQLSSLQSSNECTENHINNDDDKINQESIKKIISESDNVNDHKDAKIITKDKNENKEEEITNINADDKNINSQEKITKLRTDDKNVNSQEEITSINSKDNSENNQEETINEKNRQTKQINSGKEKRKRKKVKNDEINSFLTTGAFATRRAMRQLQDEHGFVPNPYGYTYNQSIEILNTRSSKQQFFWERGTLVAMKPGKVCVRYDGWDEQYDEWVMVGSRRIRIAQHENDNLDNKNNDQSDNHKLNNCSTESTNSVLPSDSSINSNEHMKLQENDIINENSDNISINKNDIANDLLIIENNPELISESKKKKKQRVILGPEDYQRLGMLITEVVDNKSSKQVHQEQVVLQEQQVELNGQHDNQMDDLFIEQDNNIDETSDPSISESIDKNTKSAKRKKSTSKTQSNKRQRKQKRKRANDLHDDDSEDNDGYPNEPDLNNEDNDIEEITNLENDNDNDHTDKLEEVEEKEVEIDPNHGFIANVYGYDYMQHVQILHLDKRWYEGRLILMDRNKIRVHYCGWPDLFDEDVTLGSRRLKVVENQHAIDCLEPNYQERYEESLANKKQCNLNNHVLREKLNQELSVRRITLDNVHEHDISDSEDKSSVTCQQCKIVIKQFRYYCTYCESSSDQIAEEIIDITGNFDLCLRCFDHNFPFWHQHPRSSFAVQSVINSAIGPRPIKGELVTVWEEDIVEEIATIQETDDINDNNNNDQQVIEFTNIEQSNVNLEASQIFSGLEELSKGHSYRYLKQWKRRKTCAFCNDDDDTSEDLGKFIGPFVIKALTKNGVEKKRSFWVHDSCARYTPEVFCTPEGKWYNVTLALRRGRGVRCYGCKEKGATIGCFESKCNKSFHLPCAQKPVNYFKNGVIFWCPTHEAYYNKFDTYVNIFNCDGCNKKLDEESWYTCLPCATSYFSSFDLCADCYEAFPQDHPHSEDNFEETSYEIIKETEAQKATEVVRAREELRALNAKSKTKPSFIKRKRKRADGTAVVTCCYCGTDSAEQWRKAYDGGVLMCVKCYELALLVDNDGREVINEDDAGEVVDMAAVIFNSEQKLSYVTSIDEYTHKPYLTRDALSSTKFSDTLTGPRLPTYEPQPTQIFSLIFDSTYFDIPGRAPRWASHSGTDYHGTWLPQSVRRALLKYTKKDERVLSNFLGRGTDAIECFLLQRRCCGIDINPAAVTLSQRNCCFELPIGLTEAKYRPLIAQSDARNLSGSLFSDESFHHILSHPPYKDCVAYSTHLDGDLSRFTTIEEFKIEYAKVVGESWRVLKMGRRLTLGIGDNREHCFYIPVSFHLMRQYIDEGFELEELIVKRQRYCSAFGLGTYLCVQFDFLVFTHEFLATFRKIPREKIDRMVDYDNSDHNINVKMKHIVHGVPSSAIARKSVVMGTVWIFKPTGKYSFSDLCTSRMVERFGKDESNWEHIQLEFMENNADLKDTQYLDIIEDEGEGYDDDIGINILEENESSNEEDHADSNYEQERRRRIEENNKALLKLGLISELSEESEDVVHYENMMNKPSFPKAPLCLMIMEHQSSLEVNQIGTYRKMIVQTALEATEKLNTLGMLIIGTQDIRDPLTGKLWPIGMLVLEDIERAIDRSVLKLKEMVITVPDGYSKDRKISIDEALEIYQLQDKEENIVIDEEFIDKTNDHLSIVHAIYMVFQKLE